MIINKIPFSKHYKKGVTGTNDSKFELNMLKEKGNGMA